MQVYGYGVLGNIVQFTTVHCSLVYQFEHSGKVRRAWFKFGFENFYSSLLSGLASFLCAALMSPQRTKQYCPQIEYIYIHQSFQLCERVLNSRYARANTKHVGSELHQNLLLKVSRFRNDHQTDVFFKYIDGQLKRAITRNTGDTCLANSLH